MIRVSDVIERIVRTTPFLEEGLQRGIINYTALARELRPEVRKILIKDVETAAIVMTLRRLEVTFQKKTGHATVVKNIITDMTVRSHLVTYTYANSPTITDIYAKLHHLVSEGSFCNISQGVRESTVIISEDLGESIEKLMKNERKINTQKSACSISMRLTEEANNVSGTYAMILKLLAWEGITILEIVSTYQELTLVVGKKDIDKAFSILKEYMLT